VGLEVFEAESAEHATTGVRRASLRAGIAGEPWVLHADNGASMISGLMQAIYEARASPGRDWVSACRVEVEQWRALCQQYRAARYEKTWTLARELLNDGEAIFPVLAHPELPLTHNKAERALRHGVIARKLSLGTRTLEGSRAYGLLASVIAPCRKR
jgi:hypothetical protein